MVATAAMVARRRLERGVRAELPGGGGAGHRLHRRRRARRPRR
ncbi:MAG: hypothetical protein U5L06_02315 [Rhodovibrio sp.]|nr:hypothetical protein [Rhodovibrio sp.]